MLLATLLLLCPLPQSGDAVKSEIERPAIVSEESSKDSAPAKELPAAPEAKIKTDAEALSNSDSVPVSASSTVAAIAAAYPGAPVTPAKPVVRGDGASDHDKKTWWALVAVSSGVAVLDAWSTRRAISGGYGTEANPLLRPFANSGAMYAAVQVSPIVLDVIGRKMMTSQHHLMRKLWWAPQMAGTDMSVSAAIHNLSIAH